jgi:hypothetical protein
MLRLAASRKSAKSTLEVTADERLASGEVRELDCDSREEAVVDQNSERQRGEGKGSAVEGAAEMDEQAA